MMKYFRYRLLILLICAIVLGGAGFYFASKDLLFTSSLFMVPGFFIWLLLLYLYGNYLVEHKAKQYGIDHTLSYKIAIWIFRSSNIIWSIGLIVLIIVTSILNYVISRGYPPEYIRQIKMLSAFWLLIFLSYILPICFIAIFCVVMSLHEPIVRRLYKRKCKAVTEL